MSRTSRMALIAAMTLLSLDHEIIAVPAEDDGIIVVGRGTIGHRGFDGPSALTKALIRSVVQPTEVSSWSYDWEVDPAVLSRPVEDTMPTQAGVRSNARHRTMTTLANGADPQVPGTCKEKRSSV